MSSVFSTEVLFVQNCPCVFRPLLHMPKSRMYRIAVSHRNDFNNLRLWIHPRYALQIMWDSVAFGADVTSTSTSAFTEDVPRVALYFEMTGHQMLRLKCGTCEICATGILYQLFQPGNVTWVFTIQMESIYFSCNQKK